MNQSNLVTVIIVVAGAVIPYLLLQTDVQVPAIAKVALTAINIALAAYGRLSGTTAVPTAAIASPIQTPDGQTATVTATQAADDSE